MKSLIYRLLIGCFIGIAFAGIFSPADGRPAFWLLLWLIVGIFVSAVYALISERRPMNLRFSIRSLLIAVALIAVGVAVYRLFNPPPVYQVPAFRSGWLLNESFYLFGQNYHFEISEEAIRQTPVWDLHRSNPPISAHDAMVRADKLRLRLIQEGKVPDQIEDGEWEIFTVELRPSGGSAGHWYWLVRFQYTMSQTGPPNELLIPVLMDGTVIEPTIKP